MGVLAAAAAIACAGCGGAHTPVTAASGRDALSPSERVVYEFVARAMPRLERANLRLTYAVRVYPSEAGVVRAQVRACAPTINAVDSLWHRLEPGHGKVAGLAGDFAAYEESVVTVFDVLRRASDGRGGRGTIAPAHAAEDKAAAAAARVARDMARLAPLAALPSPGASPSLTSD